VKTLIPLDLSPLYEAPLSSDGASRFHAPAAFARYFEDMARHKPEAPVARLGLVRAWRALGEPERARAELEVLRRLNPDLAGLLGAGIGPS
jgi:hypothetical protein